MANQIEKLESALHNVFEVVQIAPGTFLEDLLGADYIQIEANSESEIHRHVNSENIVYVIEGHAIMILNDIESEISEGDRVHIGAGVYHGFRTSNCPIKFMSIQIPPILDLKRGIFDKEVRST